MESAEDQIRGIMYARMGKTESEVGYLAAALASALDSRKKVIVETVYVSGAKAVVLARAPLGTLDTSTGDD